MRVQSNQPGRAWGCLHTKLWDIFDLNSAIDQLEEDEHHAIFDCLGYAYAQEPDHHR